MSFTVEQKSQLAKLMATENLTVQHQKIRTARFDPHNRILYCPIWKDMSGNLYDLLMGHEVGHAQYTPAEGWHDVVTDKTKNKSFKSFLNVVEDARIEKKIKRKYPGLSKSFRLGYQDLMDRDFFGLRGRDINSMAFINRLNLYTKSQYTMQVDFSPEEQKLVDKVMALETWDDVVRLTGEIYEYSKDEQYDLSLQDLSSLSVSQSGDLDEYEDEYEFGDDSYDTEQESDSDSVESKTDKEQEGKEQTEDNDGDGNGEETENQSKSKSEGDGKESDVEGEPNDSEGSTINHDKKSEVSERDQFVPSCETDDNYRSNEGMLLDEQCREYLYLDIPKAYLENIVTPAKRVQQLLSEHFQKDIDSYVGEAKVQSWVQDFKQKNERYVGLLAKEFEMRKAAKAFSKSKLSDTGDIDITKLASYRFDDNIFRKVMLTPKGKSHGMVLLLDRSGSMSNNMSGSIEQILVLAMFCRKVNIPFAVYGFGDNTEGYAIDRNISKYEFSHKNNLCFSKNPNSIAMEQVYLREYINSKMPNSEFSKALRNMIMLKKSYETKGRYWKGEISQPEVEALSNTPMTQALVAMADIMKQFKSTNNLDLTSLIIVHDGDADGIGSYHKESTFFNHLKNQEEIGTQRYGFDGRGMNVVIMDKQNKFQKQIKDSRNELNSIILDWFRQTTGSKVFGFFIVPDSQRAIRSALGYRFVFEDGNYLNNLRNKPETYSIWYNQQKELSSKLKSDKFLVSHNHGYNSFYFVSGGADLMTEDDEMEITGKVTTGKLKNAFSKMNKKKQVSRILVSKFIQGIAA